MKITTPRFFLFGVLLGVAIALIIFAFRGPDSGPAQTALVDEPTDPQIEQGQVPVTGPMDDADPLGEDAARDLSDALTPEEAAQRDGQPAPEEGPTHAAAAFAQWLESPRPTDPEEVRQWRDQGLALARERSPLMAEWIAEDAERAIAWGLSPRQFEALPEEIQALVERPIAEEGFFGVLAVCQHGEGEDHSSFCEIHHDAVLNFGTFDAEVFQASIYGMRKLRLTEENASIIGVAKDGKIALHEDDAAIFDDGPSYGEERFAVYFRNEVRYVGTLEEAERVRDEFSAQVAHRGQF